MTMAEKYFNKATEEINYGLDNYNDLLNQQIEIQEEFAWAENGEDWEEVRSTQIDSYDRERILKFKDSSYLKVIVNVVDGYASDFYIVKPHKEMITTYREVNNDNG